MNDEPTEKIIDEKYAALPEKLKAAVDSPAYQDALDHIAATHHLDANAEDKLDNCIYFCMLGLSHPKDFIRTVSQNVGVDAETAHSIAHEVNEKIFRPIRDELKTLYKIEDVPARKPLSAELEANAGIRPAPPPPPYRRPIDAELQDTLHNRVPPSPPPSANAGKPQSPEGLGERAASPAQISSENLGGQTAPQWKPRPPIPEPPPRVSAPPQRPEPRPVPPPPRPEPRSAPQPLPNESIIPNWKPTTPTGSQPPAPEKRYANPMADSGAEEEVLSREEILRGIENPQDIAVPPPPRPRAAPPPLPPNPSRAPGQPYRQDPYREPIE